MTKIGDKVGFDCCTGDVIGWTCNGQDLTAEVVDTWANGVNLRFESGETAPATYRFLQALGASYVSQREKVSL